MGYTIFRHTHVISQNFSFQCGMSLCVFFFLFFSSDTVEMCSTRHYFSTRPNSSKLLLGFPGWIYQPKIVGHGAKYLVIWSLFCSRDQMTFIMTSKLCEKRSLIYEIRGRKMIWICLKIGDPHIWWSVSSYFQSNVLAFLSIYRMFRRTHIPCIYIYIHYSWLNQKKSTMFDHYIFVLTILMGTSPWITSLFVNSAISHFWWVHSLTFLTLQRCVTKVYRWESQKINQIHGGVSPWSANHISNIYRFMEGRRFQTLPIKILMVIKWNITDYRLSDSLHLQINTITDYLISKSRNQMESAYSFHQL